MGKQVNRHCPEAAVHDPPQHGLVCRFRDSAKGAPDPTVCDAGYCIYDSAHGDYVYTAEWAQHLTEALVDPAIYDALFAKKAQQPKLAANGRSAA